MLSKWTYITLLSTASKLISKQNDNTVWSPTLFTDLSYKDRFANIRKKIVQVLKDNSEQEVPKIF